MQKVLQKRLPVSVSSQIRLPESPVFSLPRGEARQDRGREIENLGTAFYELKGKLELGSMTIVPVFPPFANMTSYVSVPVGPR